MARQTVCDKCAKVISQDDKPPYQDSKSGGFSVRHFDVSRYSEKEKNWIDADLCPVCVHAVLTAFLTDFYKGSSNGTSDRD